VSDREALAAIAGFWPSRLEEIAGQISGLRRCETEIIGQTAGGRDITGVTWTVKRPEETVGIIGGAHGHEPGGPAAVMNIIHVLETGRDLKGKTWPGLREAARRLNFAIIPVLNVDGRLRGLDSFVGLPEQRVRDNSAGVFKKGFEDTQVVDRVEPEKMELLGARFNDAGRDLWHESHGETIETTENRSALAFFERADVGCLVDLHARSKCHLFYIPAGGFRRAESPRTYHAKKRQLEIAAEATGKARDAGMSFGGLYTMGICDRLHVVSRATGALDFTFEGMSGCSDRPPQTHEQIIDAYLFAVEKVVQIGLRDGMRKVLTP